MKVWFLEPPADPGAYEPVEVGSYVPATTAPAPASVAAVDRDFDASAHGEEVAAWLVPAGLSGDPALINRVVEAGRLVMVAVNGLGSTAYAAVSAIVPADRLINLFDAREQDNIAYLEQLAWLAAQPAPFAVMARSTDKLVQAAAIGATHLIVPDPVSVEMTPIMRIVRPRVAGSPRPTSAAEVDHLVGRESSLTVCHPLAAGETLEADNLAVVEADTRGLSPMLRERVAGRIMRYDIAPGEPLTFGHLMVEEFS